jgi:DNA modification methylase
VSFYRKTEIPPHLLDYFEPAEIGLEETPAAYVAKMVEVFAEVRRVLRDDGTLWLNIGDSYNAYNHNRGPAAGLNKNNHAVQPSADRGLTYAGCKPKDLLGIPWLLAFALRADGWYLRSEIIWHKPNPMPESVTDRPSKAHEQIFLLSKSPRYFYDAEAVKEAQSQGTFERFGDGKAARKTTTKAFASQPGEVLSNSDYKLKIPDSILPDGCRNKRSVWSVPLNGFKEAHFATFPPAIPETCLKAGTSAKGCCSVCGTPWERVTESERVPTRPGDGSKVIKTIGPNSRMKKNRDPAHDENRDRGDQWDSSVTGNRDPERHVTTTKTTGWQPGCECGAGVMPCLTLDVFNGAGTSGLVAAKGLGLRYIGFELNPEYADMARRRIERGFIEGSGTVKPDAAQRGLFT